MWDYEYDPFGRRIAKKSKDAETRFIWDGDVVAIESVWANYRQNEIAWFYEPGTFRPLARQADGELLYILTDHLGTPKEMVEEAGRIRWAADHDTWGTVRGCRTWKSTNTQPDERLVLVSKGDIGMQGNTALARQIEPDPLFCPIRFQGQWEDEETGLYYNRFRYYEPMAGQYVSSDPIGFSAGPQNYNYVSNPLISIDPWGLQTLYRVLRHDEDPCAQGGIHPKNPNATYSIEGHVATNSRPGYGSQYVSTTKDIEVAQRWAVKDGNRIAEIDSDKIDRPIHDISSGCCIKHPRTRAWAINSAEVLIEGTIPCSAIVGIIQ